MSLSFRPTNHKEHHQKTHTKPRPIEKPGSPPKYTSIQALLPTTIYKWGLMKFLYTLLNAEIKDEFNEVQLVVPPCLWVLHPQTQSTADGK